MLQGSVAVVFPVGRLLSPKAHGINLCNFMSLSWEKRMKRPDEKPRPPREHPKQVTPSTVTFSEVNPDAVSFNAAMKNAPHFIQTALLERMIRSDKACEPSTWSEKRCLE